MVNVRIGCVLWDAIAYASIDAGKAGRGFALPRIGLLPCRLEASLRERRSNLFWKNCSVGFGEYEVKQVESRRGRSELISLRDHEVLNVRHEDPASGDGAQETRWHEKSTVPLDIGVERGRN